MRRKYDGLYDYLKRKDVTKLFITFAEIIEKLDGDHSLPASAYQYEEWWSNDEKRPERQCYAWLEAGFEVETVNLSDEYVSFRKNNC